MPIPMNFREIADDLAARIKAGDYKPGERLPSYNELREMYSISASTVARVYASLVDRGVAVGSKGVGVYVKPASRGADDAR